jgi:cytochrome c-type biogenesis protein CcmH
MSASTDWVSAIAILAGGLLLGALFVFFFTRRRSAATAPLDADLEQKDLEAKRDALVAQLRALPDDAIDERARLESETADVLRRLDKRGSAPAGAARVTPERATAMNPTVKGFLWGAGSFAALATLGYFVMQSLTPREDGQEATGTVPMAQQQQQQPATDPIVQQLEAAVRRDPDNFELRNALAQAYLERDNMMGVFEQTKYVLDRNPNDSRAMTFNALVRVAMGEVEAATAMLQRATKVDPKNLDGWVALAWVYAQSGRMSDAEAAIGDAARVAPNEKVRLEQVLAQMKAAAQNAARQPAAGGLPEGHPPVGDAPPAAPTGQRGVRVTLDLDPAARLRSGVLFVIARNPSGGPPVAVKRVDASAFPITVELTEADSMMGQPLPDTFRIEARLDSDGNATTRPPTDPSAMQDGVGPGAVVTLALK